jgi:hypothetical protein
MDEHDVKEEVVVSWEICLEIAVLEKEREGERRWEDKICPLYSCSIDPTPY